FPVGGRPPIIESAFAVIPGTLIVKTVPDLVADDGADPPKVHRCRAIWVEERGLKDRCRKHEHIHQRVEVSVDCLWGHEPFGAVNGGTEFGEFYLGFKFTASPEVFE